MKATTSFLLLGSLAAANPIPQLFGGGNKPVANAPAEGNLVPLSSNMISTMLSMANAKGELDAGLRPLVRNEVVDSTPCGKVVFIFARASTEPNNMGGSMGPWVCAGLKKTYGESEVLCQGVSSGSLGSGYSAALTDNIGGIMTSSAAVIEATKMFTRASEKCPNAVITFGGYSQGTAVMHATLPKLPSNIQNKVAGGVLFGDTRNKLDKGTIPGFPSDKVKIYCPDEDGVCLSGSIPNVTNGHFVYPWNGNGDDAVNFLKKEVDARLAKSG